MTETTLQVYLKCPQAFVKSSHRHFRFQQHYKQHLVHMTCVSSESFWCCQRTHRGQNIFINWYFKACHHELVSPWSATSSFRAKKGFHSDSLCQIDLAIDWRTSLFHIDFFPKISTSSLDLSRFSQFFFSQSQIYSNLLTQAFLISTSFFDCKVN